MTEKELKSLSRADLLELLIRQGKILESERAAAEEHAAALQARIDALTAQLNERVIRMNEAGSVAEASLRLSGVFEAAQQAADMYLESIRSREADTEAACAAKLAECEAECAAKMAACEAQCAEMLAAASAQRETAPEPAAEEIPEGPQE